MVEVLLVEDDPGDALLLREAVRDTDPHLELHHVEQLVDALEALDERAFDIVLLDLHLPDSQGMQTLHEVLGIAGEIPVVVLTGLEDTTLGLRATEAGAQDYLVKGSLGPQATVRAIRQAIQRQRTQTELRERVKELSALYATNRLLQREEDPTDVAEQVAGHLVAGFQRPHATWSAISIDGIAAVHNDPPAEPQPAIERAITAANTERGRVAIGAHDDTPFLDEERELVTAVAESLGLWLERQDALDGLRRADQRIRVTLARLPVALTTIDPDLNVIAATGGAFERLGIDPFEMLGPIRTHRPTDEWVEAARRTLSGRSVRVETRWRSLNLLHHFEPVRNDAGEVEAAVCISMDVTEARQRDAEIADKTERLHALFDNALDGIFLVGPDSQILDANPAASELVGRPHDELVGMHDWELSDEPDPARGQRIWEEFLERGELVDEWRVRRPDGSIVHAEYRAVADIVPDVHLFVIRDISERKGAEEALRASEERYRSLADGMRDVVYRIRLGPDRGLEYINPAAQHVTGFSPEEYHDDPELFRSRIHPEDAVAVETATEQVRRAAPGEVHSSTIRFRHADGDWRWLELRRAGLYDGDVLLGIQGLIYDVTDRQRAAEARERAAEAVRTALENERRAMEDLRALEALKTSFLRSVSHELRTPLTAMIGASRLLARRADELSPEEIEGLQERSERNAQRVEELLRDLLDVDTLGRGEIHVDASETDLVSLASSVVDETALDGRRCDVAGDDVVMRVDAHKVRRILEKLLDNAVKYTPDRTSITVRIEREDGGAHLVVEDEGPGVPLELRDVIFEPFRQAPEALADPSPGAGLGLAIVARLVELSGGSTWVDEAPGGGARFHVRLPDRTAVGGAGFVPAHPPAPDLPLARGTHEVVFDDGSGRTDRAALHITRSITRGALVVAFLTAERRDAVVQAIAAVGSDIAALIDDGHLVIEDATATAGGVTINGSIDPECVRAHIGGVLERARSANRLVEVFSEVGAVVLQETGIGAALHLEVHWNELGRTHPHRLLCSYPARRIARDEDAHSVGRISEHHTMVEPTVHHARLRSASDELSSS